MSNERNHYEPVIGLEIHVQLKTKSKMFCWNRVPDLSDSPNSEVCPVCLGLPGALPVPNKQAIEWTIFIGLALGCEIANYSKFDRKNYFYPDLPKGFQISQYDLPLCKKGKVKLESGKEIRIRRVHLEEDTGRLIHGYQLSSTKHQSPRRRRGSPRAAITNHLFSLIDFNRSGVPLVEIVTEPDIGSATEAKEYVTQIAQLVRYLEVSDADMEKGQMRLEPNISLSEVKSSKLKVQSLPDYKVEIKNINSFRFVERAIKYEIERQRKLLERGEKIIQETRGFDERRGITVSQRVKEEAQDYRYFPEPDIPPISCRKSSIRQLADQIPELPDAKRVRFAKQYGLPDSAAIFLVQTRQTADFFEEAVKDGERFDIDAKTIANTIVNKRINWENLLPAQLIEAIVKTKRREAPIEELEAAIVQVLDENQEAVKNLKQGKQGVTEFLVGRVLAKTKGRGNPQEIRKRLIEKLYG